MAELVMDVNIQSVHKNRFYHTRATIWAEDDTSQRAVYYCITPDVTHVEVWEGFECISADLTFAIAYLRGAGFKDIPTFESFDAYGILDSEIEEDFNHLLLKAPEQEKEMPF